MGEYEETYKEEVAPIVQWDGYYSPNQRRFFLCLFEAIEHFDFMSDFFFLYRVIVSGHMTLILVSAVASLVGTRRSVKCGFCWQSQCMAIVCLCCVFRRPMFSRGFYNRILHQVPPLQTFFGAKDGKN